MINLIQNVLGFIFNTKNFIIYNRSSEVLGGLSVLSYNVADDSQFMEHPIESGAVIADHQVFNPIEINCRVAFPPKGSVLTQVSLVDAVYGRAYTFDETYKQLINLYKSSTKLTIKTQANVYTNMYLVSVPTDVTPETIDRQIFNISFKEAIIVEPEYIKFPASSVANSSDASYTQTGEVLASESSTDTSILASWLN